MPAVTLTATDGALLDAVRTLRWPARKRSPAGCAGAHRARVLGTLSEFTEHRAYRQGDDPKRIDWKLLARSERVYIQLSNDRTVLPTTFVVDASASLAYPVATLEKWHYARLVALGLAAAAHGSGDPVGLMVATAEGPRHVPLRTRRGVIHEVARVLADITPGGSPALAPLVGAMRPGGRIAIVSDFLGDADALLTVAATLCAAGREVYAVHVIHVAELDPPHRSAVVADPERDEVRRPLTADTRRGYLAAFRAWRTELSRAWRVAGAVYTEVVTSEPVARSVRRIVVAGAARTSRNA